MRGWFDAGTIAGFGELMLEGHRTLMDTFPHFAAPVGFGRWDGDREEWRALPPQMTRIRLADRAERFSIEAAAGATMADGTGYIAAPADVRTGDRFGWIGPAGMQAARVIAVEPEKLGLVAFAWTWMTEEVGS